MKNDYRILGLEEGADEKAIKRAYFKLIRTYSPEKDPERFQEIRAAYERLTEEKEDDSCEMTMEAPADPFAEKMLAQIQALKRVGNYRKAAETAEEGIRYFGETEIFLYELARCSMMEEKTGKAVKCYEKLEGRYPDKLVYKGNLAKAYFSRGYGKKALAAFRQAFELGWREPDFMICYSQCCMHRECPEEGIKVLEVLAGSIDERNRKKRMMDLLDAHIGMAALSAFVPERFPEIAGKCREFLESSRRLLKEYGYEVQNLYGAIMLGAFRTGNTGNPEAEAIKKIILELFPDAGDEMGDIGMLMQLSGMLADERIGELTKRTVETFMESMEHEDERGHEYFMELDAVLCQLEEWPKQKKEVDIIRDEYGSIYEFFGDFWNILQLAPEQRRMLRDELRMQYADLEKLYGDGIYYTLYPDRRPETEEVVWDSFENGIFVRDGKKVGRNDPCPCGRGKKYKKCCMGKK